uniref:Uncharacterized protein n=1 Tax=Arundo donax TaxID=35708 RepID=A0A0A8YBS2_ARUDO
MFLYCASILSASSPGRTWRTLYQSTPRPRSAFPAEQRTSSTESISRALSILGLVCSVSSSSVLAAA